MLSEMAEVGKHVWIGDLSDVDDGVEEGARIDRRRKSDGIVKLRAVCGLGLAEITLLLNILGFEALRSGVRGCSFVFSIRSQSFSLEPDGIAKLGWISESNILEALISALSRDF